MYENSKLPNSIDRWQITCQIRTESPLHVGDGERVKISTRACKKDSLDDADPYCATVFTAYDERPFLPATSIKGSLRAWSKAHGIGEPAIEALFGHAGRDNETDPGSGGAVTFHDAHLKNVLAVPDNNYRFWSTARSTGLSPQVVINPGTRSAEESLLYYVEYVPEGAVFEFAMTAQGATEGERSLLVYILENAFSSPGRPAQMGSNVANGWGRMALVGWEGATLDARAWLKVEPKTWRTGLTPLDTAAKARWRVASQVFADGYQDRAVRIHLTLDFTGAMLVNDPTRRKKAEANGEGGVGHSMVRKENGDPYLPAESVRGAFRAQARRIWQTLAWSNPGQNISQTNFTNAVRKDDLKALAGFYKLFGTTGWRAPIEFEEFRLVKPEKECPQEFVAVDRFTGGAAGKKKFRADGLWRPVFKGTVTVRVERMTHEAVEGGLWMWLLLAYTLRDWMEGDCSIGFGRSKNYGRFVAAAEIAGTGLEADMLRGILRREAAVLNSAEISKWAGSLESLVRGAA